MSTDKNQSEQQEKKPSAPPAHIETVREWTHGDRGMGKGCVRQAKVIHTKPNCIPDPCRYPPCGNDEWFSKGLIDRNSITKDKIGAKTDITLNRGTSTLVKVDRSTFLTPATPLLEKVKEMKTACEKEARTVEKTEDPLINEATYNSLSGDISRANHVVNHASTSNTSLYEKLFYCAFWLKLIDKLVENPISRSFTWTDVGSTLEKEIKKIGKVKSISIADLTTAFPGIWNPPGWPVSGSGFSTSPPSQNPTPQVTTTEVTLTQLRITHEKEVEKILQDVPLVRRLIIYRQLYHEGIRFDTSKHELEKELIQEKRRLSQT